MTEQEKRMGNAQEIVLKAMQKTASILEDIPAEGVKSRLEWLKGYSGIMLRLSEAMKNVSL